MKSFSTILALTLATNAFAFQGDNIEMHGAPEPIVFLQRGASQNAGQKAGTNSSPLLTYRGGNVLHASKTMAIFWGPEWNNAAFAGDKIVGLEIGRAHV